MIYIQGLVNIAADTLTHNPVKNNIKSIKERYGLDDEDIPHPTNYKTIMQNQQKDEELIKTAQNNKDYSIQNLYWADNIYSSLCKNCKIVISK